MVDLSKFTDIMPTEGFLGRYLDKMVEVKHETPLPMHFLCAAVVVGHLIGHKSCVAQVSGHVVYPHINALLVSPAGECRRSEGSKLAMKVAALAGANVFSGKGTAEGLVDELIENGDVLLYASELSMLLGKREHEKPVLNMLTDYLLHGLGEEKHRTRTGGKKVIPRINLSMVGTTAPSWFGSSMPDEAYGGGFMSRFFVCYLAGRDVYHIDLQANGDYEEDWAALAAHAKMLVDEMPQGQVPVSDEANKWMQKWYEPNQRKAPMDVRLAPHHARRPANMLRMAMILMCSDGARVMEVRHLEQALALIEFVEPTIYTMYSHTDEMASYMSRGEAGVLAELAMRGGEVEHKELCRLVSKHFQGGMREVREALFGLKEKGMVISKAKPFSHENAWPPQSWALVVKEAK